jgi:hypothetical protein
MFRHNLTRPSANFFFLRGTVNRSPNNRGSTVYLRGGIQNNRTGAAIYTATAVARSTGPNRPYCEFRVLLRRFAGTA